MENQIQNKEDILMQALTQSGMQPSPEEVKKLVKVFDEMEQILKSIQNKEGQGGDALKNILSMISTAKERTPTSQKDTSNKGLISKLKSTSKESVNKAIGLKEKPL